MFHTLKNTRAPRGEVLLGIVVFFLALSLAFIIGLTGPMLRDLSSTNDYKLSKQSYFAAESSASDIAYRLKVGKQMGHTETLSLAGAAVSSTEADTVSGEDIIASSTNQGFMRALKISLTGTSTIAFWGEQTP